MLVIGYCQFANAAVFMYVPRVEKVFDGTYVNSITYHDENGQVTTSPPAEITYTWYKMYGVIVFPKESPKVSENYDATEYTASRGFKSSGNLAPVSYTFAEYRKYTWDPDEKKHTAGPLNHLPGEYVGTYTEYKMVLTPIPDPDPEPDPEPIPEPATLALLGIGGLALIRRRKG